MLDRECLLYGLNALGRAHETDYFLDGHRGAAIISAVYLCRENAVEPGVAGIIANLIDEQWARTELCAPFAPEGSDPGLVDRIVECLSDNLAGLRQVGHNVIFPSLALKAFRDVPEAITPSRVTGICRLIESFTVTDVPMGEDVELPDMDDQVVAAEFILGEFVPCTERFVGWGQGWSGHLLTYGKALMDLREQGYADLARQAEDGFGIYIRRIRMGPQEGAKHWEEHSPTDLTPLQERYWQEREGDLRFGHMLKYPYGFYGLMKFAKDPEIRRQCLGAAYRVL